ncbi:MAG: MFS transporter [Chloroflexota bacterium]
MKGWQKAPRSLLKIFSGWFSDKLGQRKSLAVIGYGISTVTKPFLYIVSSWGGVLAVRFGDRVGKGVRTAPRDALLADSVDAQQRGLAYGLHRAGDTAGAMIGLLIALLVVWAAQQGAVALTRSTFQQVVLVSIVPAVLAVLVLAFGARETAVAQQRALPQLSWRQFDRRFRRFLLVLILFTLGNSADAFLILRAQERGLSVIGILGMLATFNFVYAALSGPLGAWSDRVGRARLITGGWLVYGLLYLGFALAQTAVHIWLLYTLYGIYYAAVEGTAKAFVADLVAPEQRGTAFGLYNAAIGLAILPASLIAGVLWQGVGSWNGFGPAAPFLWGAGLAGTAVILLNTWVKRGNP